MNIKILQDEMNRKMPKDVSYLLDILNKDGREAFLVGGCVRDVLLNREPKDWDITTNITPENVIDFFEKEGFPVIATGIKHGTVTVMIEGEGYEITTYRIDGEYSDSRKPDEVTFSTSIEEDLSRRDFTINAIAYNKERGFIDLFDGIKDMNEKTIRTVNNADERFNEDALRMMRAVRFSSQLGFDIEEETFKAINNNKESINNISKERIQSELNKILLSDNASKGILTLQESGLLKEILPELEECVGFDQKNPNHDKDIFGHSLDVLDNCKDPKLEKRLACLFHDIGKTKTFSIDEEGVGHFYGHEKVSAEMTENILGNLKYDSNTVQKATFLVENHMKKDMSIKNLKKLCGKVGVEQVHDLLDLQVYDIESSSKKDKELIFKINNDKIELENLIKQEVAFSRKDLKIDVKEDLINTGLLKEGREIGFVLDGLLDRVLQDSSLNEKDKLLTFINEEKEIASKMLSVYDELNREKESYLTIEDENDVIKATKIVSNNKKFFIENITYNEKTSEFNKENFEVKSEDLKEIIRDYAKEVLQLNNEKELTEELYEENEFEL